MASGIAMMLLFNIGAAALFLPLRKGLGLAAIASVALALQLAWSYLTQDTINRPLIEIPMFALSYLAIATSVSYTHLDVYKRQWPMRLPFGALAPAMKPTTGLVTCALM